MKKNRFITLPILLVGLLFAVVLLGCPTAAPEAKKKGGGDDGETSTAKFESETLRAGFAIFTYSKSTAGKLGFMATAQGGAFPGVSQAEKIADDFLGDADIRGGYYVRNFTAGQTRQVLISMTDKAGLITAIDAKDESKTGDEKNASNNIADILEDRNANNTSARGILFAPSTDYTLHIYDYSSKETISHNFTTTIGNEIDNTTLAIELITKEDDNNTLKEPLVLSTYMTSFNVPVTWALSTVIVTTCTSSVCTDYSNPKNQYFYFSNNSISIFMMGVLDSTNTATTAIQTTHGELGNVKYNITYKTE